MEKLMLLKGVTGTLIAYEDKVIISRPALYGKTVDRAFDYRAYEVLYKDPGWFVSGFIKFIPLKKADDDYYQKDILENIFNDGSAVLLRVFDLRTPSINLNLIQQYVDMYRLLHDRISEARRAPVPKSPVIVQSSVIVADELRKLADLYDEGFITGQEFETQKAKLLH